MNQQTIFDMLYPSFKLNKPIRLIEFFAGYGSQALALKYLGVPFEHWKTCEWAVKSIQAYKDIHFPNEHGVLIGYNREREINNLYKWGISSNYNEPMTLEQIKRLSDKQIYTITENILLTHNLVNIQQVKGKDLEIKDKNKYDYILTYSFPCQDLSLAGKGKGMSDTSTRSGMLWEVERILTECKELDSLPQVLLMENVPQVHGEGNVEDFNKWQLRLEELGYKNYWQDLIATDYGIPQTRNRCFMISILGDYNYKFPEPIPLKIKLKDLLEEQVDEKYYLSDKMINYVLDRTPIGNKDNYANNIIGNNAEKSAGTITTKGSNTGTSCRASDHLIVDNMTQNEIDERIYLRIKNANSKGYLEAEDGDGVDISSRMQYHRGTVQKGKTQTLTTKGGENNGVVVDMKIELCNGLIKDGKIKENDVIRHSYTASRMNGDMKDLKQNNLSPTLDTRCDCLGVCVGTYQYAKSDNFMQGKDRLQLGKDVSDTLQTTPKEGVVTLGNYTPSNHNASRIVDQEHSAPTVMENHGTITATQTSDLRIRKLTPKECFRLMGVRDEDFEKCAKNQSDASLYHLAGDSIVVNVLMAIFREML